MGPVPQRLCVGQSCACSRTLRCLSGASLGGARERASLIISVHRRSSLSRVVDPWKQVSGLDKGTATPGSCTALWSAGTGACGACSACSACMRKDAVSGYISARCSSKIHIPLSSFMRAFWFPPEALLRRLGLLTHASPALSLATKIVSPRRRLYTTHLRSRGGLSIAEMGNTAWKPIRIALPANANCRCFWQQAASNRT
jgi:hypothetical protein